MRRRIEGLLAGEHRSSTRGRGTELAQVRPYEPGDDVRFIDWNATARTGEPHVRVEVAERALTTWLVLDTSPSMGFGTADRRKADVADGVALAVGHLATPARQSRSAWSPSATRDRSRGRRARGGPACSAYSPSAGRQTEWQYVGATSVGEALARTARLARSRALVVCVSDFRGPHNWRRPLVELAGRHDLVAVEVRDRREQELPDVGDLWLVDPETGRQLRVDTRRRTIRTRFAETAARERAVLASTLRTAGADHVVLDTTGDWLRPFALFLRRRGLRR